jgi:hypothetical protein
MVSLLHESCLMDIELPTATPEYGPESFRSFLHGALRQWYGVE